MKDADTQDYLGGAQGGSGATVVSPYQCPTCGKLVSDLQSNNDHRAQMIADYYQNKIDCLTRFNIDRENWMAEYRTRVIYRDVTEIKENKMAYYTNLKSKGYTTNEIDSAKEDENFFGDDGYCIEHSDDECERCIEESIKIMRTNNLPALLSNSTQYRAVDKTEIKENFESQIGFIKKGLGMTDAQINKLKVKDINGKMKLAQDQITVGGMKELMDERLKPWGLIGTLIRYLSAKIDSIPRRRF